MKIACGCAAMLVLMGFRHAVASPPQAMTSHASFFNPAIHLERPQCRDFDTIFQVISQSAKVTLITEGSPLKPTLSDKQLSDLDPKLFGTSVPLEEAVKQIAAAYDYDEERTDSKTFLLRKRYSDPSDLPCVTFEEVMHALRAILNVSEPFNHHSAMFGNENPLVQFANSLTPKQLAEIKSIESVPFTKSTRPGPSANTKQAISIAKLSAQQQELVVSAAGQIYLQSKLFSIEATLNHLRTLQNKRTAFCWLDIEGEKVFGYKGPFGPNGINWNFPLSNGYISQVGSYMRLSAAPQSTFNSKTVNSNAQDATKATDLTAPNPEDIARVTNPYQSKNVLTLDKVATLNVSNADSKAQKSLTVAVSVDKSILEKPVCVFGPQFSSQEDLLRSVSKIYGLLLIKESDNSFLLSPRTPHSLKNIAQLPEEIKRLTPEPILRALSAQTDRIINEEVRQYEQNNTVMSASTKEMARRTSWQRAASAYYVPATRSLRARVQPKVPTPQSEPLFTASLGSAEKNLLALMMSSENCIQAIYLLCNSSPPKCLINPENLSIKGNVGNDNKLTFLLFGYSDDTGNFHAEFGRGLVGLDGSK